MYACEQVHGLTSPRFGQLSHPLLIEHFSQGASKKPSMSEARQSAKLFVNECQQVGTGTSEGQRLEQELYRQLKSLADWTVREFVEGR